MSNKRIKLTMQALKIPFKVRFKHASAERTETQSVITKAENTTGEVGWGESCPREYVTGESIHSVFQFYEKYGSAIESNIDDLDSLKTWSLSHKQDIDCNPAAWCAIELALLDLFATEQQLTLEALLGLPALDEQYQYSAILGDSNGARFAKQVQQYTTMKFLDYKIKLSGDLEQDKEKFDIFYRIADKSSRVRADANNLWDNIDAVSDYIQSLDHKVFAVEEPLRSKNIAELGKLGERLSLPIILDESCSTLEHMALLTHSPPERWIVNIRVSKMGGILRALSIVQRAIDMNIPILIGAQVGETSILTRAALTVATLAQDALVAQEGAFGTYLLARDICTPCLQFGEAGILLTSAYQLNTQTGLGLTVNH